METTAVKNLTAEVEASRSTSEIRAPSSGLDASSERSLEASRLPLRVAHVMPWPGLGGVATAALRLARALEETGDFHNLAFCHGHVNKVRQLFDDAGLETVGYEAAEYSYRHPLPYLRGSMQFARLLKEHRVDIIHAADLQGVYHAGVAAKLRGVPLVCHIRSNFEDFPARYKPPLRLVDHFVFVSEAVWRNFDTIFPVAQSRGSVVYDWGPAPNSENAQADARRRVREELSIETDAPLLGMIARVQPPKDFETLFRATAEVVKKYPRTRLVILGEYNHPHCVEHYRKLCALVEELRLAEHIVWTGLRADVEDVIRAMDICVLSTHAEGMPLVLLEAMALGCPVIATRAGGIPELITHEENGLLHDKGDVLELARSVLSLLDDTERRVTLGRRGQQHVLAHFNREETINRTRALYARLTGVPLACLP